MNSTPVMRQPVSRASSFRIKDAKPYIRLPAVSAIPIAVVIPVLATVVAVPVPIVVGAAPMPIIVITGASPVVAAVSEIVAIPIATEAVAIPIAVAIIGIKCWGDNHGGPSVSWSVIWRGRPRRGQSHIARNRTVVRCTWHYTAL